MVLLKLPVELRKLDTVPDWLAEVGPEDTTLVGFAEELTELVEAGDAEEDPLERASELVTVVPEAVDVM